MSDAVIAHLAKERGAILERLKALLRLPSVSTDPHYAQGMRDAREFLLQRLRAIGMQNVQLLEGEQEGEGQPAVFGEWSGAPGRPTLIVYGHYDVQPADPLELWRSPPFEPTERDGRLYARGASDVKGSTTIAVETIGGFLAATAACPVNIKLFLEGEEECGSPSLRGIVRRHRDKLAADALLSADGGRASTTVPTLGVGGRGMAVLDFSLRTAAKDGHSGAFGGAARNALHEMAALIASLHDREGRIQVAGFLDDVTPISNATRVAAAALPVDEAEFYGRIGGTAWGDPAYTVRERITLRPTIEVNGMWGGYTGVGTKTVLPSEAHAKITMRLAPGMDPARARHNLARHLEAQLPAGVEIKVSPERGGIPAPTLPDDHPLLITASKVLERLHGQKPIPVRMGGTLPITAIFRDMLGIDSLTYGLAMPDEDIHAPNEFFRLSSLDEGLRSWPMLLSELGGLTAADFAPFRH
ncbi:Acetylornithine deacetylase/Succinyl-diaminopimelate desuccinylase [Rhizobiales bacterium GAS113]|nr:Acetylornithine deacetylase/Succinyl-diaminopimelate desuccinylase [Rhizobiales bacterium GAS113]